MKIAIVTTWFERGAAYVSKQFHHTLSKENEVFIYARGGEEYAYGDSEWDKEYVTWGKRIDFPIPTYIDIKDFKVFLSKNKIDLVIFNEQWWWEPIIVCNQLNIKTAAYIDYYTELTIPFFSNYDFLICNTRKHYEAFKWHKQCFYVPWGTDTNLFKPKEYNLIHKGKVTFFHSCGMNPHRKGTDQLLLALEKLEGNFSLIIHAQIDLMKELSPKLQKVLEKLIANNKVELLTKTIKAPGAYFMGDVYVYPTRLEGIGLTICEASASGLPVIVPNNSPMNEFIKDNVNGSLVEIKKLYSRADGYFWPQCEINIESLSSKMQYYIDNIDKISTFKKKSREYSLKYLDWEQNSLELNKIVSSVKLLDKLPSTQKNALHFYNKKYPSISKYKLLYQIVFYVYRKFLS